MSTIWASGLDLHGVEAKEIVWRWDALKELYARKEIFLRARPNASYEAWHYAMDHASMEDLLMLLDPEQIQFVVDILTFFNEIYDLHYASEYNTV